MSMTTLAQVHAMLPGSQLIHADMESARAISISGVGSDSRQIQSGELFIALSGERFNAHHFLGDVAAAGASAALISDKQLWPENLAAVCVQDVKQGLGELAKAWRAQLARRCNCPWTQGTQPMMQDAHLWTPRPHQDHSPAPHVPRSSGHWHQSKDPPLRRWL